MLDEVKSYLNSFLDFEKSQQQLNPAEFKIERVRLLLERMGNPQDDLKFIHVAGTKGKGSTCIFIASILKEAGYTVGLYTSPHLHAINERIRVLDKDTKLSELEGQIADEELVRIVVEYKSDMEDLRTHDEYGRLTYFEVITAIAIFHFARREVDFVVLETGLGGRLDATNVVNPLICAITSISFDHEEFLGDTIEKIASEKAGIIKRSAEVVIGPQKEGAIHVLLDKCVEQGIQPTIVDEDLTYKVIKREVGRQIFEIEGVRRIYDNLQTSLLGDYQIENAAIAIQVAELLEEKGYTITDTEIEAGIKNVAWPGRCEVIDQNPVVILDCAHNEDSAQVLVQTIGDYFPNRKIYLVLGISSDKDKEAICNRLASVVDEVVFTQSSHPRAYTFSEEDQNYFSDKPCQFIPKVDEALRWALEQANKEDVVLVTGSVFTVGEARGFLKDKVSL